MSPFLRDLFTIIDAVCWPVCFWWMHRISKRQDTLLEKLQTQAHRIESVSKEEHEILKELHPTVQKIEEKVTRDAN